MDLIITDRSFRAGRRFPALDRWISRLIADPRDIPMVYLIAKLSLIFLPFSAYLLLAEGSILLPAIVYLALFAYNMGPFILMLHNISHRRLWRGRHRWLELYVVWILGPLFGETPNSYFVHHIGMHHPENNFAADASSTMRYRRDSAWHFALYVGRFLALGFIDLCRYMLARRRTQLFRRLLLGELCYWSVVLAVLVLNPQAALVVLIIPFLVCRFAMMAGNWAQHAFVDASSPDNNYRNSITCVNSGYNRRCFNDGYHIGHHLKPTNHWSEMPGDFERNIATYAREGAIVFHTIDFTTVWMLLMFKRYGALARYYVPLGAESPAHEHVMALLKERTRPIR